jgi:hypothetical protein
MALWIPPEPGVKEADRISAYWQHRAVCTLREIFPTGLVEELSDRLGKDSAVYLRRQISGEYPVLMADVVLWAVKLNDITVLPQFDSAAELLPPTSD